MHEIDRRAVTPGLGDKCAPVRAGDCHGPAGDLGRAVIPSPAGAGGQRAPEPGCPATAGARSDPVEHGERWGRYSFIGVEPFLVMTSRDGAVSFEGWKETEELNRSYASHHALVLSSDHESYGRVILEAFAHGMPVVSSGFP